MEHEPPASEIAEITAPETVSDYERPHQLGTDWRSLYICTMLAFCTAVQFSLYFASLWPYLHKELDPTATESFFGFIVAVYSLGQILASPLVGYLANRFRKIRFLLYAGILLMLFGNGIYLMAHLFKKHQRKYMLLFARFVTGIGSSNISLLKAYTSMASSQKDRSRAIALVTGGVALGMTMGPAFQLLFTPLDPGFAIGNFLTISIYTAPALLACAMNLLNFICVWALFREVYAGVLTVDSQAKMDPSLALPKPDIAAVLLCYFTRFTQMFIHTNLETLGTMLAMLLFAWDESQTVKYFAIAQAIMSFLAFLTYLAFIFYRIEKIMNFRINLICSLIALILFHLLTFSYPFLPGHVQTFSSANQSQNGSNVGCDTAKFNWCDSARPLSPFYFYSCYILFIGLAFPNINVTLNTIFSKVIGPRRQGTQQGFLQMSGGTARMLGPVVISYLYTWFGPQSAWLMEIGLTAITLAYWFILYRRMVPLKLPPELLAHSKSTQMDSSSSSASSSSTRRKRKKNVEERKPLFDPIEEEGADGEADEVRAQQQRNQATVSTVASLRDEEGGLQPQ